MRPLPDDWRAIAEEVQVEVNALPYVADAERYKTADFWEEIDEKGGDCEDFALGKLRRLLTRGFPIERLRLAVCIVEPIGRTPDSQRGHAVLVVDAQDDHYALDNRFTDVVPVLALIGKGYTLLEIQKVGGSREWVEWRHT